MATKSVFSIHFFFLQSADMSPASSTTSLPVSPLTEEPLPFKVTNTPTNKHDFLKIVHKYNKIVI